MSEQMAQELLKRLDSTVDKLGTAGVYSWDLLVRKVYWIDGWAELGFALLFALMALFVWRKVVPWCFRKGNDSPHGEWEVAGVGAAVVSGGLTIVFLITLQSSVARILMPNYYAIQAVLELLKK